MPATSIAVHRHPGYGEAEAGESDRTDPTGRRTQCRFGSEAPIPQRASLHHPSALVYPSLRHRGRRRFPYQGSHEAQLINRRHAAATSSRNCVSYNSGVPPAAGQQLWVRATLHDPAVLHHQDLVGARIVDSLWAITIDVRPASASVNACWTAASDSSPATPSPRRVPLPATIPTAAARWSAAAAARPIVGSRALRRRCPVRRACRQRTSASRARRKASHS